MATLRPKSKLSYWARRAIEDEAAAQRLADSASARIKQLYLTQYKKTALMMERLYAQVQDGKTPGRTALWNYSRWREMEKSLSSFVKGGSIIEREAITGCLDRVFKQVIGAPIERFKGEGFTSKIDPDTVINTAWSGENYTGRIWKNRTALADRIRIDMEDMVAGNKSLAEARRELMHEFDVGYYQADRLLRTESSYVFNRTAIERYKRLGVDRVEWITQESGYCKICHERDGVIYPINTVPTIPAHPNCNCTYGAYTDADEWIDFGQKTPPEVKAAIEEGTSLWYNERVGGDQARERAYEKRLKEAQTASKISGQLMAPTMPQDLEEFRFDDGHANGEREHGITRRDALMFITNAVVRIERQDGRQVNFYSEDGAAYVLPNKKLIRTAFWAGEFARDVKRMLEVLNGQKDH